MLYGSMSIIGIAKTKNLGKPELFKMKKQFLTTYKQFLTTSE